MSQEMQNQKNRVQGNIPKSTNPYGNIKHVIAVMSGKGGVGKSSVTALLATWLKEKGYKVGILDADITGPSIPKLFGIKGKAKSREGALLPVVTVKGIEVMSINLLLDKEDQPVIWRGPLISGVVKQFYEEVDWGDLDFLLVDLPPGTGDAPLTVMQFLPLDGIVVVTSPQELVGLIVRKAIHMAKTMNVSVVGFVENMSYLQCPKCGEVIELFGRSKGKQVEEETGIPFLGSLPLVPDITQLGDEGRIELVHHLYPDFFKPVAERFMEQF
ncbi:Mrp family chromosome partitioning ATPase [Caldicoprobacter guelmensis]|uniref:Mrp/NBP35 family ATP-binding protein n=1 Tax=Caldicoprobacter guelmensis TaxID=1170224 RepID=UPI00195A4796|nr:Mrp/NBP35 family ATP-binding protein [Caldicoprobacter guelmensis]MBM7582718.1 Mrp family chromosome partitioning ATPase [Caldicoprobacter guelmensis]